MKRYFKGFYMSLGMFCAIPLPLLQWDEGCISLMLPCLPLVGVLIGTLWLGLAELLAAIGITAAPAAALVALIPHIATGFLHLDGFMDTSDAVLSGRPLEDKLRILKDPHTGAFAVISLAVLFVLQYAAVSAIIQNGERLCMLAVIPVVSRCLAALSVLTLRALPRSGYAKAFSHGTGVSHRLFVLSLAVIAVLLSFPLAGYRGLLSAVSVIIGFMCAMAYAYHELKGVSGDLAGFALVIGELCGLFALAVTEGL